jgi:ribose-phosphate pyrophosphokinase
VNDDGLDIYSVSEAGRRALNVKNFDFPDGQPHVEVADELVQADRFIIRARIRDGQDLLRVLVARDSLRPIGLPVDLEVLYLLGARMDRRIDRGPFTLNVVADVIKTAGFQTISILDPHSDVAVALLGASVESSGRYVVRAIAQIGSAEFNVEETTPAESIVLIAPDAGAAKKVELLGETLGMDVVNCLKHRDASTGALSKFRVMLPEDKSIPQTHCLIVDDICDGGRTFTGVATELRACGFEKVYLYVTHGIFSADYAYRIPGIDGVFTTNSYDDYLTADWESDDYLTVFDVRSVTK